MRFSYSRIFFFPPQCQAYLERDCYFVAGLGTYLLVMNGLPEEGTEWEKSVSFMLVTGLGGLERNTMWVKRLRQNNDFKLPTIHGGEGWESELSLVQDPRESLCMPTALFSWYKGRIPWAHRDWNTREVVGHGPWEHFPTGFEPWCLVESCFCADQEFWKFCGPLWRWSFLISWSERTHIELRSHPVLFVLSLSADAVGQHQDSCSCSLADPREELCGVNLAWSFIVFISHEEKQWPVFLRAAHGPVRPCIGSSFLCFISVSSCHSLSCMSHIRFNQSPGP